MRPSIGMPGQRRRTFGFTHAFFAPKCPSVWPNENPFPLRKRVRLSSIAVIFWTGTGSGYLGWRS